MAQNPQQDTEKVKTYGTPAESGAPQSRTNTKTYDHPKKATPIWMWLLPLLALLALGTWYMSRSHDTTPAASTQTDSLKPDSGARPAAPYTAANFTDSILKTGRASFHDQEVHFETAKGTILPDSTAVLDQVAAALKEHGDWKMSVQGHTDNVGSAAANQPLSQERAEAVVAWLGEHGVDRSRLIAQGFGDTRPVATNDTDEGRAQNRRVELVKQ